ncbi:histidine phosphatase superfamily [Leucosporidium creatinivorum]|uniref:Histidine phosphatase superfamily n=1 Tax=Leucosporidium creatinivorum TaxID=106004 RepID=A0A1Y2DA25_9BASI|nr:histidine phosphatase superfamily [Leucosporidium creatinivorum]
MAPPLKQALLDSDNDAETSSSSPLLPTANISRNGPSGTTTKPSLYHRLKLDYLSTAALLVIVACWASGAGSSGESSSGKKSGSFPTNIGFEGPTPTGVEAFAAATAYPSYRDTSPIRPPSSLRNESFNILDYLGNLSPWHTVNHGIDASAQVPAECKIEQVQLLHRHGARYPTTGAGPAEFAKNVVGREGFKGTGELAFLNDFEYKLGAEILTPFGREQLFALGVSFRTKYGQLLDAPALSSTAKRNLPVFRTESQDRMTKSSLNFAAGFFGIPYEEQYHQLITLEWPHYNNTLSPYMTCINANRPDLTVGPAKMNEWISVYLTDAWKRLGKQVEGVQLTLRDVFNMQLMCAYELVALGGSEFCALFNEDEWRGFEYAHDIQFWYIFSFGQPSQAALGLGWVQEWLARVTKQPIVEFNSTTNSSYHTTELFPLDQALYVDATHDTIISAVLTTLNLTSFASSGPLPSTHIPDNLSFVTSKISPFAANLHSQIVSCGDERRVRWILNDGVVPLDNIKGCGKSSEGWCPLDAFVSAMIERTSSIRWEYDCLEPFELGSEPVLDGRPSSRLR